MANFAGYSDFDVDAQEIEQRRKYAEMLRQQSMEPVQSQMAGGYVVPVSPLQGLAKMLQAYSGRKGMETADADKKALAEALRNERMGTLERFQGAMEGRPEEQGTDPTGGLTVNPAQAPNPRAAMMALATSRDPMLSQAGIGAYLAQLSKTPESAFSKINPRDYTAESVRAFAAGGGKDFSVLVPRDKVEFVNTGGAVTPMNPYTAQPTGAPINKTVSPDAAMRQRWDEYTFGNLSKNQQESLKNDRAGLGMRGAELFYNTGMTGFGAPGGAVSGPVNVPSMVPGQQPVGAPLRAAPQAPAGQIPPAPQVPQMRPGQVPQGQPLLTPKQQAERNAKLLEEKPAAENALTSARAKAEVVNAKVSEALQRMEGLMGMGTTGLTGAITGRVPGTPAFQLERALDTIKANLGFQELAAMRAASPTGGALGSVTERELAMLQSTVASLDKGQSKEQLRKNLEAVQRHFNNWRDAIEQSYAQKFGAPPAPPAPQIEAGGASNVIDELLRKYGKQPR